MNVSTAQLFEQIGRLYTENTYLNQMVAEKNAELSVLHAKLVEPKVDDDDRK